MVVINPQQLQPMAALLLMVLGTFMLSSHAYPPYFHSRGFANSCIDAPTSRIAGHFTPVADPSILVKATLQGTPVTSVCPGQTYDLSISFGGSSRAALLTVSGGSLAETNVASCPNAMTTAVGQRVQSLAAHWALPCTVSGTLEVKVTSGTAAVGSLGKASAIFAVNTACAASSCKGASSTSTSGSSTAAKNPASSSSVTATGPPSAPLSQSSGATPAATSTATSGSSSSDDSTTTVTATDVSGLTVDNHTAANSSLIDPTASASPAALSTDDPTAQTLALLGGAASTNCPASSLGYQCSQPVADGITIHYTYGGAGQPGNSCTQGAGLDTTLGNATSMMHFAIESALSGYAAIGFPLTPGTMVPADAVIGSVDESTGAVQVETYRLSSEMASGINAVQPVWATGLGATRTAIPSKATIVCFSRPLNTSGTLVPVLDPAAVQIIWAAHTSLSRQEQHIKQGSLTLNMQSGRPAAVTSDDSYLPIHVRYAAQIAHGVLMAAAFCAFMPAGVLMARHKWLLADHETGRISPVWFKLHQTLQQAGIICALASFILAMALFYRKNGSGNSLHGLYTPHFGIGIAVTAMSLIQPIIAAMRPGITARFRPLWRLAHYSWGWAILGLGIANCFLGVVLAHDLKNMSWVAWLVPMCVLLGLLVLAGLGLEVGKIKVQLDGSYDPKTHTCASKLPSAGCSHRPTNGVAASVPAAEAPWPSTDP